MQSRLISDLQNSDERLKCFCSFKFRRSLTMKRQLSKNVLAQTFKFDCDRFLRLKLATPEEKKRLKISDNELAKYRPGIDLVKDEGIRWETEKYQDLIDLAPPGSIVTT